MNATNAESKMFRIGQKVVCIAEWASPPKGVTSVPIKGQVYTIRDVETRGTKDGRCGLRLYEIVNPPIKCIEAYDERAFCSTGFRPVVEKKTDISWAEEILRRESIETPERVS